MGRVARDISRACGAGRVVHVADAVLAGFAVLVARCYFIFELNMRSQMMIDM